MWLSMLAEANMCDAINEATDGWGVEVLLEMSGNEWAINDGLKCLANLREKLLCWVFRHVQSQWTWPLALVCKGRHPARR